MNMTVELNRMRQTLADRNSSIAGQRQQLAHLHSQLAAAQTDRDRSERALRDALRELNAMRSENVELRIRLNSLGGI